MADKQNKRGRHPNRKPGFCLQGEEGDEAEQMDSIFYPVEQVFDNYKASYFKNISGLTNKIFLVVHCGCFTYRYRLPTCHVILIQPNSHSYVQPPAPPSLRMRCSFATVTAVPLLPSLFLPSCLAVTPFLSVSLLSYESFFHRRRRHLRFNLPISG